MGSLASRFGSAAVVLFVAGLAPAATRADSSLDQRYATWLALFAHGPVHGDAWLWVDAHARFGDAFEPRAVLVRPGLTWRVHPDVFLTAGYAWTPSWRPVPDKAWGDLDLTDEHRVWQQALYQPSDPTTGLSGQVRVRVEQRFRTEGELDVGVRVRLFARGQIPLTRDRAVIAVMWNEVFLALNDTSWRQAQGFDQNRLFFGLGWLAIPGKLRLELGYTNQWIVRDAIPDPVNHIAALNSFVNWR